MNPAKFLTILPEVCDSAFIGYVESCFGRAVLLPIYSRKKLNEVLDSENNKELKDNIMNWLPTDDAPLVLEDDPDDAIVDSDKDVNKVQEWEEFLGGKCSYFDKKYRSSTWFYVYDIKKFMQSKMEFTDKTKLMNNVLTGMNYQPFEKRTWAFLFKYNEGKNKLLEQCERIIFYTEPDIDK